MTRLSLAPAALQQLRSRLQLSATSLTAAAVRAPPRLARAFSAIAQPINLALMGAPGVGKGTFATRLSPLFGIPTISTGDLIRAEIKAGTPLGREVKALTERGGLVDDAVVAGLLEKRLAAPDAQRGFIIDGYPRRLSQASALARAHPIAAAVNLVLDEEILVEKALARRVCPQCGAGYNLADIRRDGYDMPPLLPKHEDTCDKCGTHGLIRRADDTEPIIRERLAIYHRETFPIIDFYKQKGVLLEFKVKKGVADLPELKKLIETRLKKN